MRRFVILDRDGTLNREVDYLSSASQVELYPGVGEGLRILREIGMGLVVTTNQSGLARGFFDLNDLDAIHSRLRVLLAEFEVKLDGLFFCPHLPEDGCRCRKPRAGMVERAVDRFSFDPAEAFVIGDKPCDIGLGEAVGATTLLVRTGYGESVAESGEVCPDHVADDLVHAAAIIRVLVRNGGEGLD